MSRPHKAATALGSVALVMALLAFVLGSAPFTPALGLVVVAAPFALVSAFHGAWRLGIVSMYFSSVAWIPLQMARGTNLRLDYMLAARGVIGLGIAGALLYGYVRSVRTN